jgi:hypothetical protein
MKRIKSNNNVFINRNNVHVYVQKIGNDFFFAENKREDEKEVAHKL